MSCLKQWMAMMQAMPNARRGAGGVGEIAFDRGVNEKAANGNSGFRYM
jgi:hypothetical protein